MLFGHLPAGVGGVVPCLECLGLDGDREELVFLILLVILPILAMGFGAWGRCEGGL